MTPNYPRTDGGKLCLDGNISTVDRLCAENRRLALRRERRDDKRDACADVGRSHRPAVELRRPRHDDAMRVALHDLSAHLPQVIDDAEPIGN